MMKSDTFSIKALIFDTSGKLRSPVVLFFTAFVIRLIYLIVVLANNDRTALSEMFADTAIYLRAADYLFGINTNGQYELYMVGAGYPFFLGACKAMFGNSFWPVLFFQVVLSSLSCVMICKIADLLLNNRLIAFVAGMISVLSITSISLSASLLTETLFFFLLTLSLYLFIKGLSSRRWRYFVTAGICGGLMVVVRSAAMFIPLIFIALVFLIPSPGNAGNIKLIFKRSLAAVLIMILMPSMWAVKNKISHDILTLSGTGIGAAKVYLTAQVLYSVSNRPSWEFTAYRDSLSRSSMTDFRAGEFKKAQSEAYDLVVSTFKRHPLEYFKKYFSNVWENVTAISSLQNNQLPALENYSGWFYPLRWGYQSPVMLILSLIGLAIIFRKNIKTALALGLFLMYFGLLSGVTFWQGSRIFYPAQVVQTILAATTLVFLYDLIILHGVRRFFARK